MTDKEINIAIAECCGWTKNKTASIRQWERKHEWCQNLPNYTTDLNAMHSAEKCLIKQGQRTRYVFQLQTICGGENFGDNYFATAHQRAEAFLRTLGKWKE